MYRILIKEKARKFLEHCSKRDYKRFSDAIWKLAHNPLVGDIKKLKGVGNTSLYRLRVGKWRVLFVRDDTEKIIHIYIIEKRGDIY